MSHSYYNKSHCYDPTAKLALDNVDREIRRKGKVKPVARIGDRIDRKTKKKLFKIARN